MSRTLVPRRYRNTINTPTTRQEECLRPNSSFREHSLDVITRKEIPARLARNAPNVQLGKENSTASGQTQKSGRGLLIESGVRSCSSASRQKTTHLQSSPCQSTTSRTRKKRRNTLPNNRASRNTHGARLLATGGTRSERRGEVSYKAARSYLARSSSPILLMARALRVSGTRSGTTTARSR